MVKRTLQRIVVIGALFPMHGCTIATYELRDELKASDRQASCDITFSFELESSSHTNTYGTNQHVDEALKELKIDYINSTIEALNKLDCSAKYSEDADRSILSIYVKRQVQLSALPQEWLTGLSFGLIPSWGTRYSQFIFTFDNKQSEKTFTYEVDQNSYNHLILFPVFWVTFFTADEQGVYRSAIANFIKSN
jgi:hypothetical protein